MSETASILVVDDSPEVLQVYSELLRTKGFTVLEASSAREALRVTTEERPSLVLLDVRLPDLSGIEVCRQIKHDANLQDVFVALFSGEATGTDDKVDGLTAGADDYIARPVAPHELLARVHTLLRLREVTAALRASEQHCRRLVELLPEAVASADLEGRLVAVNPQGLAMLGYQTASELLGKSFFDLTPPEEHERVTANIATVVATGTLRNVEYTLLKKGGRPFAAEVSAAVSTNASGQATGLVVVARDVTERKAFETALTQSVEALRNNTEFLQTVVNALPSPVYFKDLKGRYLSCNRAFEQYVGLTRQHLRGKTVRDVAPKDLADLDYEADRELLKNPGTQVYESSMVHADGSRRAVIINKATFQNTAAEVAGIVGSIVDITERKRTEEQIRLLADALQSTSELICITDQENRFTFANRAFLESYGYGLEELLGQTPHLLASPQNPAGLCDEVFRHTLETGWRGELFNVTKNGKEFPISLSTSQIKDGRGRIIGLVGVARDITERRQAEKRSAAFSLLGYRLSAASTPEQAAQIILEVASSLFGWDAAYLHLYSQAEDRIIPILTIDTVDGKQTPVPDDRFTLDPSPLMRQVMSDGARLINSGNRGPLAAKLVPFGDTSRRSASMMYVPVQSAGAITGILSIQSYAPQRYTEQDLGLLQTLADRCGDALERIRVAEALARTEAKYRSIFENATEGIFQSTPDGHHLSANAALADMFGYGSPEELMTLVTDIGRQSYVRPEAREELKRRLETQGAVRGFEAECRRKDGRRFWVSISARAVRDSSGAVVRYEGTAQDITVRRHAEVVLRESEGKFRTLFESAPIGIALLDATGRYLQSNQAYQQMLGYTADELQQLQAEATICPDDVPESQRLLRELRDGTREQYQREQRFVHKNGRLVWTQATASAVRDDARQLSFIISAVEDISIRKEAQEALRRSERNLRLIAENTTDVIFAFDMNRLPLYANSAVEKLTGYTFEEIRRKKFVNWIHPEDQKRMLRYWEELYAGKGYSEVQFRLVTKNKEIKWCSSTWGPLLDENKRQIGVQGRERDITQLKRGEQLRVALSQLGNQLSAVFEPEQAAKVIFEVASDLFSWDAGYVALYSKAEDRMIPVLSFDTVAGQRIAFPPENLPASPTPLMRLVIEEGPRLVGDRRDLPAGVKRTPFGNPLQRAACSMFVPIIFRGGVMGILTLQSYTPKAYSQQDLQLLQTLADHCGGALQRIAVTAALREAESRFRSIFENATEGIFQTTPDGRFRIANPALAKMLGYQSPEELMASVTDLARQSYVKPGKRREFIHRIDHEGAIHGFEFEHYRKDRSIIWVSINAHAVRDSDGTLCYYEGTVQDITKRKRAEEALEMSQILQKALLDNIPDPAWLKDGDGRFLACNEPLAELLDQPCEQVVGRTVFDLDPHEATRLTREDHQVMKTRKPARFETMHVDAQGRITWFETIKSPLLGDGGKVSGTVGIARDITERKWVENLLRVQLDFGVFLSLTNDLIAATGRLLKCAVENEGLDCGAVYLVNPQTKALDLIMHHGLSVGFAQRAAHFPAVPEPAARVEGTPSHQPNETTPMARVVEQLKREALRSIEVVPIQHAGEVVAVLNVGSHVHSEIPWKTRSAVEALSAQAGGALGRIRAEQTSRANRELLEKTLHNIHSAVLILDAGATVIHEWNPAATAIFGYTREEMLGRALGILHVDGTVPGEFSARLENAIRGKEPVNDFELVMRRKDGKTLPTEQGLTPLRDDGGRIQGWVNVVRDITEHKRSEEKLREVSRRIIEAQEAERLRVARELHDGVNQIIASAKMRLRRVRDHLTGIGPAAQEILHRCDQLLVQALEENRRIAHDLRPADLDALGLNTACRNFCKDVQSRSNLEVKHSLMRRGERLPPAVQLNLFRIVQEAITNAERHSQAKTVRLRIAFQRGTIVLTVQDDGCGFEPTRSRPLRQKGHGLGLTNMRERASALGGTVAVASAPGKGTTVTVRVPCEKPQ